MNCLYQARKVGGHVFVGSGIDYAFFFFNDSDIWFLNSLHSVLFFFSFNTYITIWSQEFNYRGNIVPRYIFCLTSGSKQGTIAWIIAVWLPFVLKNQNIRTKNVNNISIVIFFYISIFLFFIHAKFHEKDRLGIQLFFFLNVFFHYLSRDIHDTI